MVRDVKGFNLQISFMGGGAVRGNIQISALVFQNIVQEQWFLCILLVEVDFSFGIGEYEISLGHPDRDTKAFGQAYLDIWKAHRQSFGPYKHTHRQKVDEVSWGKDYREAMAWGTLIFMRQAEEADPLEEEKDDMIRG